MEHVIGFSITSSKIRIIWFVSYSIWTNKWIFVIMSTKIKLAQVRFVFFLIETRRERCFLFRVLWLVAKCLQSRTMSHLLYGRLLVYSSQKQDGRITRDMSPQKYRVEQKRFYFFFYLFLNEYQLLPLHLISGNWSMIHCDSV